jgi:lysophospholipase L1-like esterase
MIDLAKAHNIEVLCAVLPAADFLETQSDPANKIIALNTILTHYANVNAVTFVDCHWQWLMTKWLPLAYSNDGVHPNKGL